MEEKIDLLIAKVSELQMNINWLIPRMAKAGILSDLESDGVNLALEISTLPISEREYSKPPQRS